MELKPAGLDSRHIKDVADEAVEAVSQPHNAVQILPLLLVFHKGKDMLLNALGAPQDRRQGGSEFMTQMGQKFTFCTVLRIREFLF